MFLVRHYQWPGFWSFSKKVTCDRPHVISPGTPAKNLTPPFENHTVWEFCMSQSYFATGNALCVVCRLDSVIAAVRVSVQYQTLDQWTHGSSTAHSLRKDSLTSNRTAPQTTGQPLLITSKKVARKKSVGYLFFFFTPNRNLDYTLSTCANIRCYYNNLFLLKFIACVNSFLFLKQIKNKKFK